MMNDEIFILTENRSHSHSNRIIKIGVLLLLFFLIVTLSYSRIWEAMQPYVNFTQQKVVSIEMYSATNDLHWSSKGYRVYLKGVSQPIDFPIKNYNKGIKVGSVVDITIRKSFSWYGLLDEYDGIAISFSVERM